jgi:hypothetical protein
MNTPSLIIGMLSLSCAAIGAAAEPSLLSNVEVRIVGGPAPGYDSGYGDGDKRIGSNGELLALYHQPLGTSPLGMVLGIGLFDDGRRAKANNPDNVTEYDAQGIVVTGGVSYAVMPKLSLEARAEVRGGEGRFSAQQTFANGNYEVLGNYGRYIAGSAVAAVYYTFPFAMTLGLEAGYDDFIGKSDYINNDLTLKGDGLLVRAAIGYRF